MAKPATSILTATRGAARGSTSRLPTSRGSQSTPSSTPPTARCSAAEASTARSTAPPGRNCLRSAAACAAAPPATPRSPPAIASPRATSSIRLGRCGTAAAATRMSFLPRATALRWRSPASISWRRSHSRQFRPASTPSRPTARPGIAVSTVIAALPDAAGVQHIVFCCFDRRAAEHHEAAFKAQGLLSPS